MRKRWWFEVFQVVQFPARAGSPCRGGGIRRGLWHGSSWRRRLKRVVRRAAPDPLGVEETDHEIVRGAIDQVAHRPLLNDLSIPHQDDEVAEIFGFGDVVGDQDDSFAKRLEDAL